MTRQVGKVALVFAGLLLLAAAFGGGAWAGASYVRRNVEEHDFLAAAGGAMTAEDRIARLERKDFVALREALDTDLDGHLLHLCRYMTDSAGDATVVRVAKAELRRGAEHRRAHPPTYSALHPQREGQSDLRRLGECLADATK